MVARHWRLLPPNTIGRPKWRASGCSANAYPAPPLSHATASLLRRSLSAVLESPSMSDKKIELYSKEYFTACAAGALSRPRGCVCLTARQAVSLAAASRTLPSRRSTLSSAMSRCVPSSRLRDARVADHELGQSQGLQIDCAGSGLASRPASVLAFS